MTATKISLAPLTRADRMDIHDHDALQLYSARTPNGIKVAACLEELHDLRSHKELFQYEPVKLNIEETTLS